MMCMKQPTTNTSSEKISNSSLAQRERLAYIEFRLFFLGDIRRQDLMERFSIAPAAATRDFTLYREQCPDNIDFEGSRKTYILGKAFKPIFEQNIERVLETCVVFFELY